MLFLFFYEGQGGGPAPATDITVPTNLSVVRYGSNYVELIWNASIRSPDKGVDHYRLYINGEATWLTADSGETSDFGTGWEDGMILAIYNSRTMSVLRTGLSPNTQYSFYVTAVDNYGGETDPSNTVTITTARNQDVGRFKYKKRYPYDR